MVRRYNLNAPPARKLADLVAELNEQAKSSKTGAHGIKHMGEEGDSVWVREDGTEHSVREIDEELEAAQERIDEAEKELEESRRRVVEAKEAAEIAQGRLDELDETTLPAVRAELEAQAEEAQREFEELNNRLANFATDEALSDLRDGLQAARDIADSANAAATAADTAAKAASQAALEAAGIAASKGRVIVQEAEPQGEDRQAANIWIKPIPDDPDTDIEEKAVTYVYLVDSDEWIPTTSDELAQAAQNALDAREAAQQAQQRADTAVSNAAAAQAAAEAAQRTANEATTDARDAHNAAVAAQEGVRAAIERGDSLIVNGSFEQGMLGWGTGSRWEVVETDDARSGNHVLRFTPVGANSYPRSDRVAIRPGQVLYAQAWFKYLGGSGDSRLSIYYQVFDRSGTAVYSQYARNSAGGWNYVYPADLTVGEWTLVAGRLEVPDDPAAVELTVAPHVLRSDTDTFDLDDVQLLDVTEAWAAQARAEEAYELAESRPSSDEVELAVKTSANGKNAITVSASAPSGSGVVVGDTWWRVDGNGDIFGQWAWDGSKWVARTIRSEVIANLDVNKLVVSGAASIDEAVINKLFAETFAVHKITADKLLVSGSQNLIPGVRPGSNYGLSNFDWDEEESALRANGRQTVYADEAFTLVPGEYVVEADIKASVEGTRTYIGLLGGDDVPFLYRYGISNVQVSTEWQSFAANLTVGQGEGGSVQARFLPAYSGDTSATTWYRNVSIRQKVGSVLIEDGAISTPKLDVTEEMTAALVQAMDVATKRLIVSEEMIAYHATLLGETVVEQINVLGKLVGVDGVFTGTVDFSNINVTGEVLAERIMAAQGLIAGNPGGDRLEINNDGLILYGIDVEGHEYVMVHLGPSGENLLTIGDSTISEDSIASLHGEFEDLTVGGDTLVDLLAALPRGRVAQNRYETWSQYSDAQQARLHVNFTYIPGRTYRVTMAPFFLETLSGTAEVEYRLVGKWDERSVGWADSEFAWARVDLTRSRVLLVPGLEGDWRWTSSYEREAHVTLMVWARSGNPVRMIQGSNYPAVLSVDDVGPELNYEGDHWTSGNRGDGGNQAPPTPAPSLRTATYNWGYGGYGGDIHANQIVQGVFPGVGERWGGWRFTAGQLATLANMHSIIKFEVYLYADHWYYGSGGTAVIRANNGSYKTVSSEQVVVSGWKRKQGRWVSLPASWFPHFLSRRWQGISVRANSSSLNQYGRFVPTRTRFRVRYRI